MPAPHSLVVLSAFLFMGIALIIIVLKYRKRGIHFLGKPAIDQFYFLTAKGTLFTTWLLFIVKAVFPKIGYIQVPPTLAWIAASLLWIAVLIVVTAFFELGESIRVGLPSQKTELKTTGIYRYSRNPLYVGTILISMASCLYFPDLVNVCFTCYGIFIHHRIIKGEEAYLSATFGQAWADYQKHVRRYV